MIKAQRNILTIAFAFLVLVSTFSNTCIVARAQALSAGTVSGVVLDPNGAVVPNANVTISNPITGYKRAQTLTRTGHFALRMFRRITTKLRPQLRGSQRTRKR